MTQHEQEQGENVTASPATGLVVPDRPIILYIEGDGTGPDICRATRPVLDAAVAKAYGDSRRIFWQEILAGEKAFKLSRSYLPVETLTALREYRVALKGPLTTPIGGGFRSLNVTLRQVLDLYACIRPVRYYAGVPSPLKEPEKIDMVIFRENTEDLYAGVEWPANSPEAQRLINFLNHELDCTLDPVRGHRHQAHDRTLQQTPDPHGPEARPETPADLGDPDAQRQHHEIHRRGLSNLGL